MNKKIILLIVFLLAIPLVSALTGSIGNAKAIIEVNLDETKVIERTVLVKNVNNESINIRLEASDAFEEITDILDKEFSLNANEEKNARFRVNLEKPGNYNGNIVVFFSPKDGKGAGVVLQSNLIIKASGKESDNIIDNKKEVPEIKNSNLDIAEDNIILDNKGKNSEERILSFEVILFIVLVAIIVISIFVVLMRKV